MVVTIRHKIIADFNGAANDNCCSDDSRYSPSAVYDLLYKVEYRQAFLELFAQDVRHRIK